MGEPVTFNVNGGAAIRYEVHDYFGNVVDQGAVNSPLTVNVSQPGWYKIDLFGAIPQAPWGTSVGGTTFVIFRPSAGFPALPPKGTYGGDDLEDEVMRGLTGMGPQRHKVDDCNDPAGAIAKLDKEIAVDQQDYLPFDPVRGRVLMIAFPNGTGNQAGVRQIVDHFKSVVTYWEGRNEPNSDTGGADFVAEERAFSQTVKSVSPSLKVLGPGIVTIGPFGLSWMDKFFANGGGQYIDALSFHAYNNVNGDMFLARQSLDALQGLLNKYNLGNIEKWQTEQGYMAAVYGAYQPRLQGRWTMLQMMLFEQYGIPKEHNHLWYDVSGFWDEPMFWENDDSSLNPAAPLMRVWAEELYGANYSKAYSFGPNGDKLYLGDLFTGPGRRVAALMSAGSPDGRVTLGVSGGASLHTVSAFGVARDLPVVNGQVTLPVSEVPVYVEMAPGQDIQPVPINWGPNLALGATPTASGTGQHPVDPTINNDIGKLVNGYMDTFYWSLQPNDHAWMDNTNGFPAWVQLQLPSVQTIDHVLVYACPPWQWEGTLLDYELQYDSNGQWVTIDHVQEPANTSDVFTPTTRTTVDSYFSDRWVFQHQFPPVTTGKIRLLVHNTTYGGGATLDVQNAGGQTGPNNIALREVEVYNSTAPATTFRINCGDGAYSSATAGAWQADAYYGTGSATYTFPNSQIAGTSDPSLYQSVRYSDTSLRYVLPASAGSYTLKLYFVEGDRTAPGQRVFNVSVNGAPVLTNFDVFKDAGGQGIADVKSFPVTCDAGGVTIDFHSILTNAMVSAIELIPAGTPPPPAPSSLSATPGDGQVSLAWTASGGATSYSLYRAKSPGGEGTLPVKTGLTGTNWTDTGLNDGTTYYYKLTAVNSGGESLPSNEVSVTPVAPIPVPPAPSGLSASAGDKQVALAWSASAGAATYNIYRGTAAGAEGAAPVATGVTGTSYTDAGLTDGTTYYYKVSALNVTGEGPRSGEASATPTAPTVSAAVLQIDCGAGSAYTSATTGVWQADTDYNGGATWTFSSPTVSGTTDPALYSTVRYGNFVYQLPATAGAYTLKLHFMEGESSVALGARLFNVSVNGSPVLASFDVLAAAGARNTALVKSIPVTAGANGVTISFQSLSVNPAMVSAIQLIPSGPPAVPPAPSGLSASAGDRQVALAWSASAGAATYSVYRGTAAGAEGAAPVATGVTGTSYTDAGLADGTAYYYRVTATDGAGESGPSNEASATPAPAPASVLQINCGGGVYTSASSGAWQADADFTGGAAWTFPTAVSGTSDPSLFQSVRYSDSSFSYHLPASAGSYTLKLYFVEGDKTGPGQRVFNVSANGSPLLTSFDVFKDAGGQGTADVKSFPVTAGANGVTVSFQTVATNAMISAIQLVPR